MNIQAPKRMTVDEYLVWALDRPGRYELIDGVVRQMTPQTAGQAIQKMNSYSALKSAIRPARIEAFSLGDGMAVRISSDTSFEPDALAYMPPRLGDDMVEVLNPIIVVENASTSTRKYDSGLKLEGYKGLPSVHHILLVHCLTKSITHHRRVSDSKFEMISIADGVLRLDPPGLEIPVADFFAEN